VLLRYAARVNGLTEVFLTKLDVLSGLSPLRLCTGYRYEGETYDDFPAHQSVFHKAEPVFEDVEGWDEDISAATTFAELPPTAQAYVRRIEELGGVPVRWVSVGAGREQSLTAA
jgi:adenylosuccinate synthase